MILVDTGLWIDHLRKSEPIMIRLLEEGMVLIHPWVVGELALGNLARRHDFLELLACLPKVEPVAEEPLLSLIEDRHLEGRGIGLVDLQLVASALAHPCRILTRDRRLKAVAEECGIAATVE